MFAMQGELPLATSSIHSPPSYSPFCRASGLIE